MAESIKHGFASTAATTVSSMAWGAALGALAITAVCAGAGALAAAGLFSAFNAGTALVTTAAMWGGGAGAIGGVVSSAFAWPVMAATAVAGGVIGAANGVSKTIAEGRAYDMNMEKSSAAVAMNQQSQQQLMSQVAMRQRMTGRQEGFALGQRAGAQQAVTAFENNLAQTAQIAQASAPEKKFAEGIEAERASRAAEPIVRT